MARSQLTTTARGNTPRKSSGWALKPLRPWSAKRGSAVARTVQSAKRSATEYVIPNTGHIPGRFREADAFRSELGLKK